MNLNKRHIKTIFFLTIFTFTVGFVQCKGMIFKIEKKQKHTRYMQDNEFFNKKSTANQKDEINKNDLHSKTEFFVPALVSDYIPIFKLEDLDIIALA